MDPRARSFLDLSSQLTGFDCVALAGTGMVEGYLRALDEVLPAGLLERLVAAWRGGTTNHADVLDDALFGPVARNIILLWYRGTWSALPQAWRTAHGASPHDVDRVISGAAYRAGLQWIVAGAHPAGAAQQGYAAWASPPTSEPSVPS